MHTRYSSILLGALMMSVCGINVVEACSRFTYSAPDNTVITGRTMDWFEDLHTDLWALPAGMTRVGAQTENAVKWTAKYGSLVASAYDLSATDGVNSQGLDVNLLYLSSSTYGEPRPGRPTLSVISWAQYMLDNYATVAEAVEDFGQDKFNMIAPALANGVSPMVHVSITDPSGDNAVFEYIKGKLVVHHDKHYTVMTNEPSYDKQLALNEYWQNLQGAFLPGTTEPGDRFVRASYYLEHAPKNTDEKRAVATVFSILSNVSAPFTVSQPNRPNVASTLWRSVADLKRHTYYFAETDRPNVFWVDIEKLDLKAGASAKKLSLQHNEVYVGEASKNFVQAKALW